MASVRTTWSLLALALVLEACSCGRAPVNNLLKQEGEACAADEECESVLCDQLPGKSKVCFRKCATGCKAGDVCTSLAVGDRYVCVPEKPGLCQGCELNVDCPYPGDRCVEIGGAKVCARDCAFDGQCPSSYRCADATDTTGAYAPKQCQPTSGTCECIASTAGQTVPCSETNSFGTCTGVKTCRPPNGYDACSAPVPTTEICNGRDDDCNGMTDENLGEVSCGEGECKRTVSNCINGSPQRCDPGTPTTEICDGKDNDCNGTADDGIDKMTSLAHCGACNSPCALPNAVPVCTMGVCGIAQCLPGWTNADGILSNGCEYPCTITNSGVEACDGVDNNCDGRTDEGYSLATDPTNCGVCGRVCNVNNGNIATYACIAGQCAIATCVQAPTKYDDCDQTYATGCEKNVSNDVNNCGGCNLVCNGTNGTATCANGTCGINCTAPFANCDNQLSNGCEINTNTDVDHCGTCPTVCPNRTNATRTCTLGGCGFTCTTGFVDLDGVAANGCEYTCTATGADDPDDQSLDQNCDGIDGDESRAIFVAKTGNNANPGTRQLPKLTVQAAINAASSVKPHVYVSKGFYDEAVTLSNGISIFGGYDSTANWARGPANVVTLRNGTASSGRIVAVSGTNITSATTLAYLTIRALDASTAGTSTYGLHCVSCSGLTVRSSVILAGAGGTGANGTSPAGTAGGGSIGTDGTNGSCDGSNGSGGAGGKGGNGAYARNTGEGGGTGFSGTPGGPGGAGGGDCGSVCLSTCTKGQPGTNGTDGSSGANGTNGSGGSATGALVSNYFVSNGGGNGSNGAHGNGGGGGGGGGGQGGGCVDDGGGNGGGGGGGGGCGGLAANGGAGGGSSFGVFLVNSTGATLRSCDISSANAGNGGGGGTGQNGGSGATGGLGKTVCTGEVGAGGNGGTGGDGGRGGHGGGGAGGASYALYKVNSTVTLNTVNLTAGNGGLGGTSPAGGSANGASGLSGQQN